MLPIPYEVVSCTTHDGTAHNDTNNHLCHHTIICGHHSKRNHARGKATNGDGDHSRIFVNVGTSAARHYTT
ncbi:hypothetical protein DEO72_LG8g2521 [Vigna unguiculata]|uniref:Uncharacterized protein n=1 Tax=Vigna unguiculata TaxID=3917 RepID=A0A4D6MX76_VIGUN|nr:hypothetical protein DEO72_LG8g2521 [Vigna unguiculata]